MENKLFRLLKGQWRWDRVIGNQWTAYGQCTWSEVNKDKDMERFLYHETGKLASSKMKQELDVQKEYYYCLNSAKKAIEVYFCNPDMTMGNLFIQLSFNSQSTSSNSEPNWPFCSSSTHQCKLDQYDAKFTYDSENKLTISYTVKGPHKDYLSVTTYDRIMK
ncbi:unnamed protein product [Blepharisma stoltei]|uniref:DUF6314 domain-containing protein n=1 Tax=Blepharisma stoltei TaxID=1481888 RepID=A0AAU9JND8_9CILI|nr:unnamed protein product [Blepharisma stoltei]